MPRPTTPTTVPSTNEENDSVTERNMPRQPQHPPVTSMEERQQSAGSLSAFSSPILSDNNNTPPSNMEQLQQTQLLPNVALQPTISSISAGNQSSTGSTALIADSSHTPLTGENIVLLSFSNDTTPADTPVGGNIDLMMAENNVAMATGRGNRLNVTTSTSGAVIDEQDHEEDLESEMNDMTLSPSSIVNIETGESYADLNITYTSNASSPPPESIVSGQLTVLSPPPLSLKSTDSKFEAQSYSGSQSLFSGNHSVRGNIPAHPNQPPTVTSAGGNTAPSKKRPPLPPRWAIGGGSGAAGNTGVASSHHAGMNMAPPQQQVIGGGGGGGAMVDVVPSHIPPPKQIGPMVHRRVLSTGDASFLSNLTDPESINDAEDNSWPLAAAAAATSTMPPVNETGAMVAPNTTTFQPLPMNPARKRGVSWDFGTNAVAASTSESDGSVNRYKNEEVATFDTLGILQPLLFDEDNANIDIGTIDATGSCEMMGLMQPILVDESGAVEGEEEEPTLGGTSSAFAVPPPPPPPPPEKVVRKHQSDRSLLSNQAPSSKHLKEQLKQEKKDNTQFEDEAELAILEALNAHNLRDDKPPQEDEGGEEEPRQNLSPIHSIDNDSGQDDEGNVPFSHLEASHRKDVSALTITRSFDNSPQRPNSTYSRARGNSIFEDSAWTEEYDAQGRIDGTLPEEQDSKLVEGERLGSVDLNPRVATAASRPPLHTLHPGKTQSGSPKVTSKRIVKDDDSSVGSKAKVKETSKPMNVTKDPTAVTGLRHRRKGTIAAKNMADELAQLAAMHGGDSEHSSNMHHRTKTGGIDNLLDAVNIIAQQNGRDEGGDSHADHPTPGTADDEQADDEGNAPQDEETGNATKTKREHRKQTPRPSRRVSTLTQRSERIYHLKIWYDDLIRPKLPAFVRAATHVILFIILPLICIAFILYYGAGNPPEALTPETSNGLDSDVNNMGEALPGQASYSWWALFFVRQTFLLSCIRAGEVFTIDILALRTPLFVKTVGSFATLMVVQARGWPYILTFWSLADFCFLFGNYAFARHWLFWQDWIELFTESNPAGDFLHSTFYMRILLAMMFVGVITSLKRLWLATFLGRRSYAHYGPELEIILAKMLLISQVSHLARQIAELDDIGTRFPSGYAYTMSAKSIQFPGLTSDDSGDDDASPKSRPGKSFDELSRSNTNQTDTLKCGFGQSLLDAGIGGKMVYSLTRSKVENPRADNMKSSKSLLSSSSVLEIMQLLEEWEEPDVKANAKARASIKDILQFRQAVSLMDDLFPFTQAFGPASSRAECVQSSDRLFETLQQRIPNSGALLSFETLSEISYAANGSLIRDKVKALIRLFRPDRKGFLTKLDFVSSIDDVYKDLRLFRASLANSSSIDDSFETIINTMFFAVIVLLVLLIVGFSMWEPILSFSAFFFSFSFMFGPASSKYFEGILLIFVRRPYDIGDKVALSDPESDTSAGGSSTWFVERVTLFTTTVRFATTNEVATYSNGSLARLRIINAKRSPKAIVYVYMKFGSDVPYQMIKVYQTAIENFVKSRPREWSQFNGFRATRVEMELNFIEYVISVTHREIWQNAGPILQSKADLDSFSLEVSKKLNLRYHNPPKPIHLSITTNRGADEDEVRDETYNLAQVQEATQMFDDADE